MSAALSARRPWPARLGDFLRDHQRAIRRMQWLVVAVYAVLLLAPVFLPLPDRSASMFNNLTVLAQFAFWGVWWPFVLLSMPLMGRTWCGVFCPEGALTEWASRHGRGGAIPRWMRWGGWPFVAFALTTIYGQLISVYQYPLAVALILGGSTLGAMAVGWLYGREKRVWCRYLCPVNGVFNLLAKLSPWQFQVDGQAWRQAERRTQSINCAPLLPLRTMQGAGDCHMCGRCSDYRGAISLRLRSPERDILQDSAGGGWQTLLITLGLMGLAVGAFLWSDSPWFVALKQAAATWLVERDIIWPLLDTAPWFLLTHYPEVNDSFSWLDGAVILAFIAGACVVCGGAVLAGLAAADRVLPRVSGAGRAWEGVNKLALGLIPLAGAGVFLGLTATTLTLLQHEGVDTAWATAVRLAMLALALAWSLRLCWRLAARRTPLTGRRWAAMACLVLGLLPFLDAWLLFFLRW